MLCPAKSSAPLPKMPQLNLLETLFQIQQKRDLGDALVVGAIETTLEGFIDKGL